MHLRTYPERSEELAAEDPHYKAIRAFADELNSLLLRARSLGHSRMANLEESAAEAAALADEYLDHYGRL